MKLALDHLVVAAADLDAGARHVEALLGVAPQAGGSHAKMGTHNRLLGLFGGVYLEVIAIDTAAPAPARPRWFGLDDAAVRERVSQGPFLLHWVARVERPTDLTLWQAQYPTRIPPVVTMSRGDLHWRIAVPADGGLPGWPGAVAGDRDAAEADGNASDGDKTDSAAAGIDGAGLLPTLIQWDVPAHPSARLERHGLALKRLVGIHPEADRLREAMRWLGAADLIALRAPADGEATGLEAEIETPAGIRVLR